MLDSRNPFYSEVWMVSAFVDYQTVVRFKESLERSARDGAHLHLVVGVDLFGTSKEALETLLATGAPVSVVKNKSPGHTFHPKLYLFEAPTDSAVLIVTSSNWTEGGMFNNYEGGIKVRFDLQGGDLQEYQRIKGKLAPILSPSGQKVLPLTAPLIATLEARGEIVPELTRRTIRRAARRNLRGRANAPPSPFGSETVSLPPPLPASFQAEVIRRVRSQQTTLPGVSAPIRVKAFFMHLSRLQSPNIPGEARIPKAARDMAPSFWGWPGKYQTSTRQRGLRPRRYFEWKPKWRFVDMATPATTRVEETRMYEFEDNADFRFYAGTLKSMGADSLDIVKITRLDST